MQPDWLIDRGRRLLYRLSIGLVGGLVGGLFSRPGLGLVGGLLVELGFGLPGRQIGDLGFGLVGGLLVVRGNIHPGEVLMWSWEVARKCIIVGLVGGLVGGLRVISGYHGLVDVLVGLVVGLNIGLLSGLLFGFSTNQLDERMRLTPNQGIWRSARNGLLFMLLGGLLGGLIGELVIPGLLVTVSRVDLIGALRSGLPDGLSFSLVGGLLGGLVGGLVGGLRPFLQHFTLRFWLWCTGCLPWNLVAFLDEAADRLLLRKVGGGYIFVHRLLLDYFASLDTTPPSESTKQQGQQ